MLVWWINTAGAKLIAPALQLCSCNFRPKGVRGSGRDVDRLKEPACCTCLALQAATAAELQLPRSQCRTHATYSTTLLDPLVVTNMAVSVRMWIKVFDISHHPMPPNCLRRFKTVVVGSGVKVSLKCRQSLSDKKTLERLSCEREIRRAAKTSTEAPAHRHKTCRIAGVCHTEVDCVSFEIHRIVTRGN